MRAGIVAQSRVSLMMAMPVAAWDSRQDSDDRICLAFGFSVFIYVTSAAMVMFGYRDGDAQAIIEEENDDCPRWPVFPFEW